MTKSEIRPRTSSAATWPASSSSLVAGRVGASRRLATSQLAATMMTKSRSPSRGQSPAALEAGSGGKTAPVGAEGGPERYVPAAAPGEEVDGDDGEGHDERDQDERDRPAVHDPTAE